MADPLRLVLTSFPQRWDGNDTLTLNVVVLPTIDPLPGPLIGASTPSFSDGAPSFVVVIDRGLAALPSSTGPNVLTVTPTVISPPASPAATFALLKGAVTSAGATIGAPPAISVARIRKALPASYMAAGGGAPDGNLTTSEDDFGCAIRGATPSPILSPPIKTVTWGQVISYAMRQPLLAQKLGLFYQLSVTLNAANRDAFVNGAYVFAALAPADPWASAVPANPGSIRTHAARVPPLNGTPRALFASIEFPIDGTGGTPDDESFRIADVYSDGFAKLVHCAQPDNSAAAVGDGKLPPASDLGIQIGWDDQQVVNWQNDQLSLQSARAGGTLNAAKQMPLGILGYRVDVADVSPAVEGSPFQPPVWQSLCAISTTLPSGVGTFAGDLCVEPVPVQPSSAAPADAWLPRYFALWKGGSLCEPDPVPNALTNPKAPPVQPSRKSVGLTTLLSYGHTYSFRVRLGDLSNGGPLLIDNPVNPGPGSDGTQTFQRLIPPKAPTVTQLNADGTTITAQAGVLTSPATLVVSRPLITYPEVLYTHLGDTAAGRDAIRSALVSSAKTAQVAGLPDPDVVAVSIEVLVRHPLHDTGTGNGPFVSLYVTSRVLNPTTGPVPLSTDPGTNIPVVFIDEPNIETWSKTGQPKTGPLLIPRGRDVQITIRGLLRKDEPAYFAPESLQGMAATILTRVEATHESLLLGQADAAEPITGYYFRRPLGVNAPPVVAQLAQELGVVANGDSLCTPPGMRVVYGAAKALRTDLSGGAETLTFSAASELLRYWVVAIVLDLERDWTWAGLTPAGLNILRGGPGDTEATAVSVGSITIPPVVGAAATTHTSALNRSRTRLIFLDAIDPHEPVGGHFPESLQHRWFVKPNRIAAGPPLPASPPLPVYQSPPEPLTGTDYSDTALDVRLPIAIPPSQVVAIASVGLAFSPYEAGPLYASTAARDRSLWIELTEPIENADGDALFARVLSHGADPILYDAQPAVVANGNPPLPLDPELVREIIPDDTDNRDGLNAMTQLVPAPGSKRHFLLPLPPGKSADDPELFGFWSYELRVGHAGKPGDLRWWSTANGRFGTPLRVVGVQHPAPPLACTTGRVNIPAAASAAVLAALVAGSSPFVLQEVLTPLTGNISLSPPWTPSMVIATARYATPVLNGQALTTPADVPKTSIWFLVYAQVVQTDGATMRNVLIAAEPGVFVRRDMGSMGPVLTPYFLTLVKNSVHSRDRIAVAAFHQAQIEAILKKIHLSVDAPLSMIAVEFLPGGTGTEVGRPGGNFQGNVPAVPAPPSPAPPSPASPVRVPIAASITERLTPVHLAVSGSPANTPSPAPAGPGNSVAGGILGDVAVVVGEGNQPVVPFPFGRIMRVSPLTPVAPFC